MKPYYQDGLITVFHGDSIPAMREMESGAFDLILTDPPYGIGADKNLRANKQHGRAAAPSKDYGIGNWDSSPPPRETFELIRKISKHQIIFGGNYFSLPPSKCWLVWDKDNGSNGYADCELAWTNLDKAVRRLRYRWMGMLQENMGDKKEIREHPTQKPVTVMSWALLQAPEDCLTILDPFMGSGSTLEAAKKNGRRAIGFDVEEKYCEMAARRCSQEILI